MFETEAEVKFPAGTVRAAVAASGDDWRGGFCADARDAAAMLSAEQIRCAGATPTQRTGWAMYIAARRAGEVL